MAGGGGQGGSADFDDNAHDNPSIFSFTYYTAALSGNKVGKTMDFSAFFSQNCVDGRKRELLIDFIMIK